MIYKNGVFYLNKEKFSLISNDLVKLNNSLIAHVDGSLIKSDITFIKNVGKALQIPEEKLLQVENLSIFKEWLQDLFWLDKEKEIFLIVHRAQELLSIFDRWYFEDYLQQVINFVTSESVRIQGVMVQKDGSLETQDIVENLQRNFTVYFVNDSPVG